jgi:hypothetical protein
MGLLGDQFLQAPPIQQINRDSVESFYWCMIYQYSWNMYLLTWDSNLVIQKHKWCNEMKYQL